MPRGRHSRVSPYRVLLRYARQDARGLGAILTLTLLASVVTLLLPWPMKVLVDQVLGDENRSALTSWLPGGATDGGLLAWVVAATLVLFALVSTLDVVLTHLWVRVGQGMVLRLQRDVFARMQRRSMLYHQRHQLGDTMERVTGDPWSLHTMLNSLFFLPVQHLLLAVGMLVVLFALEPVLAGAAVVTVPAMVWVSRRMGAPMQAVGEVRRRLLGLLQAHVQQSLSGIPVVQAFGQENRVHHRFTELSREAVAAERRNTVVSKATDLLSGSATTVGQGLVLLLGARRVLAGELSLGSLLVFLTYLTGLHSSLTVLTGIHPALRNVTPQVSRVVEVLDAQPEVADGPGVGWVRARGELRVEGVWFGYEPGRPVLRGVSFQAGPGELVALVGATGAGKSTVAGLLMRMFDPESGRVLLDGHDLRSLRVAELRSQVALVLQESFLFPMSIADNIAYGRPGASREEVVAAAVAANADEFIVGLPDGYDTVVGERGGTLSGGQRQRVAIARALLKDASVLVLDEPTSALDARTEGLLLGALDRLMIGRTTVVIAHRLSTIRRADRIVVLDSGQVVQTGTHEELLAAGGLYADMQTPHEQFPPHPVPSVAAGSPDAGSRR